MSKGDVGSRIVGFDCAEELHEAVLLDEWGEQQRSMSVVNQVSAVEDALAEFLLNVPKTSDLVVVVESERSHGRLVCDVARRLGCKINQVNTVALNHYRVVEGQPHKTDPWDAYLAARMVFQRLRGCREMPEPRPEERVLCRLSRTHSRLVKDKTMLWFRLRAQFLELVPEVLHKTWAGPKYRAKAMQYILERWPAFEGLDRAQSHTIEKILRKCKYGEKAPKMARLLKEMAAQISMETCERKIVAMEITLLLQQMKLLETSQVQIDGEIALRVQAHPIGTKLLEVPGVGPIIGGVFIGELLPVARTASEGQSATYSGVTPLARKSGKSRDKKRLARGINKRILDALYKSSVVAIGVSAIDKAYYQKKLKDYSGHPVPHTAAFIALSRQRHKVIYILMTSQARYDKETLISSHLNRIQKSRAA